MKISVFSVGNKVRSSTTNIHLLPTTITEGNVKFHLGITENKSVMFGAPGWLSC